MVLNYGIIHWRIQQLENYQALYNMQRWCIQRYTLRSPYVPIFDYQQTKLWSRRRAPRCTLVIHMIVILDYWIMRCPNKIEIKDTWSYVEINFIDVTQRRRRWWLRRARHSSVFLSRISLLRSPELFICSMDVLLYSRRCFDVYTLYLIHMSRSNESTKDSSRSRDDFYETWERIYG